MSSDETLTHDGGSDSLGIANAARFAISNWGVDPDRVFAVGTSSGAMMTNVLAGAYPDVFKAGIVDSGVAFGCFALPGQPEDSWNSECSTGELILTGAEWVSRLGTCSASHSHFRIGPKGLHRLSRLHRLLPEDASMARNSVSILGPCYRPSHSFYGKLQ